MDATLRDPAAWPALPLATWKDTRDTLHMYTQIVGKIRLALAAPEREWAHVPLYVSARGLTTSAIPYGDQLIQIDFDFVAHTLEIVRSDGRARSIALAPRPLCVADFYDAVMSALQELDLHIKIWPMPVEVPNAIRCTDDRVHASYDPVQVSTFFQVLVRVASVFAEHRAPFQRRHTPVHFFWGSFDLAYGRFSGLPADPPPKADPITRLAMDAQEIAVGFWTGDDRFPQPAFYCYAYPKPVGIEGAAIKPAAAQWSEKLGEFLLSYDEVRRAPSPRAALLEFLTSTHEASTKLAGWDHT